MIATTLIHRLEPVILGVVIALFLAYTIRYRPWLVLLSILRRIWFGSVRCTNTIASVAKLIVSSKLFYGFVSILVGLLIGILFHYLIYRFTLPSKPFVYAAF
jgi:hypothetical protein